MATASIETRMYIDGQWCAADGGKTLAVINPADESTIAEVAYGGRAEADRADRGGGAGLSGLAGPLGLRPGQGPEAHRRADPRTGRRDRPDPDAGAGQAPARGQGRGAALGRHLRVVRRGRASAPTAGSSPRRTSPSGTARSSTRSASSARSPRGTSRSPCPAARSPRRWPSGCTIVSRPADQTPLTLIGIFECLADAGFPPGWPTSSSARRGRWPTPSSRTRPSARSASPARPRSARS